MEQEQPLTPATVDSLPPLRNIAYHFLKDRAEDFLREKHKEVPRSERRAAARDIARRFTKRMREEQTCNTAL
jgi:Ser/Thr protein kinase RdoA (MazF antagonist)